MSQNHPSTNKPSSFNFDENCAALKISRDIYLRILAKAVEQTEKDLQDIATALPIDNFESVQAIAHRLKGDYGNLRIMTLSSVAKQLNDIAKTTKDKDQSILLLKALQDDFLQLQQALRAAQGST